METRRVNSNEIDCLFREAYNPPLFDSEFTEQDFDGEYWHVHDAIRERLSQYGEFDNLGHGDFVMNETRGPSRWISIEFSTDKMWHSHLIETIGSVLAEQSQDYMVYLSHELLEYPLFHVLVNKECALGCCDDSSLLEELGVRL